MDNGEHSNNLLKNWDKVAESHRYVAPRHHNVLKLVTTSEGFALDIGCGHGYILNTLANMGKWQLYGIDISPKNVKIATKIANINKVDITFIIGDALNLHFQDASFDLIIASDVIEHVNNKLQLLLEMKRVLKDNGEIIISFPAYIFSILEKVGLFKSHQPINRPPSPWMLKRILRGADLKIIGFETTGSGWNAIYWHLLRKLWKLTKKLLESIHVANYIKRIGKTTIKNVEKSEGIELLDRQKRLAGVWRDKIVAKPYSSFRHVFSGNVALKLQKIE